ncbi:MAG: trypsin-like peptidase domain-containing protein, partial [Planctomycetales bacterium]|nr:trypsin-like peptidase domain-containing protein [Planctomycetales bacterium]
QVVDARVVEAQQQRVATMRRAAESTISIFGLDGGGGGSGVIISPDGYALTNYHVSSACGDHMRCGLDDGQVYDAVIVGVDATGDVSLIKLLGRDDFPTADLADSDQVRVGQWCFAAGNPFVLATNLQPSISLGIVSGVNRYQYPAGTLLEYADCIQTNPGNSGGPLFNLAGQVIGINGRCSFEKRGRVNVGVGYAISANQIKKFLGMLKSGRLVDHATLGATVSTDASGTVRVSNILSNSDAYRRGLRYGDQIIRLADRDIGTTNAFKNVLGTLPKDWRVPLTIRREGTQQTLLVRLEGVHSEQQLIDLVDAELVPGHGQPDPPQQPGEEQPGEESPPQSAEPNAEQPSSDSPPQAGQPNVPLVQSLLESRPGFANYYFNRLHRQQLWSQLQQQGDYAAAQGSWKLSGTLAGENTPLQITLGEESAQLQLGSRSLEVPWSEAMSDVVSARREGGLLVALHALRQLLQLGPERIGNSIYLGTLPVYQGVSTTLAEQPRHAAIQSQWYDATVRFHMDPERGQISLVEVFGDPGTDPVELYVDQYAAILSDQERSLPFPRRLRLQYGTEVVLLLTLESLTVDAARTPATDPPQDQPTGLGEAK